MRGNKINKLLIVIILACQVMYFGLLTQCFNPPKAKAASNIYFVDNTVVGGNNDGSSWPNAFHTIADLDNILVLEDTDTIYIKASGTPYREFLGRIGAYNHKTIYGDAIGGTGTETTRGTTKAEFWASVDTTSLNWSQEGTSGVYRSDNVYLEDFASISNNSTTGAVAWFYSAPGTVTPLTGTGNNCTAPIESLALNKVCYNDTTKKVWANIGKNPGGEHIELITRIAPLEIWTDEKLYGVVGKHGIYGLHNSSCWSWVIEGVELLYNRYGTNANAGLGGEDADQIPDPSYFRKSSIHNNYLDGVSAASGYVLLKVHYQNNLIYNNGAVGVNLRIAKVTDDPSERSYFENNTIYGNGTYGIYVKNYAISTTENLTVKNNIVFGNTTAQLFLFDNNIDLAASNNAVGTVNKYGANGIWATYGGGANIISDVSANPLLVSATDFRLQAGSPAINAGVDLGITTDYLGTAIPRGAAPDIGAYEYDITAPVLSSGSSLGSTNDNTPNFTFTSDEAGTISYQGDCSSSNTSAIAGANTVTFNTLSEGAHSSCKIIVTDPAGNASSQFQVNSFLVDITSPTLTINSPANNSSTTSSSITISGGSSDGSPGSGINTVTINGVSVSNSGSFSVIATLNIGTSSFTVIASDFAGNTTTQILTISRTVPAIASTIRRVSTPTSSAVASDNNDTTNFYASIIDSDNNSSQTTLDPNANPSFYTLYPKLKGKTYPNATVVIEIHSNPITTEVTSDTEGNWEYTPPEALALGAHSVIITVKEKDTAKVLTTNEYKFNIIEKANAKTADSVAPENKTQDKKSDVWIFWIIGALVVIAFAVVGYKLSRRSN